MGIFADEGIAKIELQKVWMHGVNDWLRGYLDRKCSSSEAGCFPYNVCFSFTRLQNNIAQLIHDIPLQYSCYTDFNSFYWLLLLVRLFLLDYIWVWKYLIHGIVRHWTGQWSATVGLVPLNMFRTSSRNLRTEDFLNYRHNLLEFSIGMCLLAFGYPYQHTHLYLCAIIA